MTVFVELLFWVKLVVAVEALTEIVTTSKLGTTLIVNPLTKLAYPQTDKLPNSQTKFFIFLHSLISCPYCFSVWAAGLILLASIYLVWFVNLLCIHRLANLFHIMYTVYYRGRVIAIDLTMKKMDGE